MKRLIIDDNRILTALSDDETVYARTMEEAAKFVHEEEWDEVWFDHDMGEAVTTYSLAVMMETVPANVKGIKRIVIHSMNPVGRQRLYQALSLHWPVRVEFPEDYDPTFVEPLPKTRVK